jgi:hypothetical protein
MDESGHDHKNMPYEIHGGVSIASTNISKFLINMQKSEMRIFGCRLSEFGTEIKGSKLLNREKFKWADYDFKFKNEEEIRKGVRRFLTAHLEKRNPLRKDMCAYGVACIKMAKTIFNLMAKYDMCIFAGVIDSELKKPANFNNPEFLRYDHVRLMEIFYLFLQERHETGIMVMDQCQEVFDNKFKRQLENYFTRTDRGKRQSELIMPEPLFIESHTNYLIQVADLCIYTINTGYRRAKQMVKAARPEIQQLFENKIHELQYTKKEITNIEKKQHTTIRYSIRFHPDPYNNKKRGSAIGATSSRPSAKPLKQIIKTNETDVK